MFSKQFNVKIFLAIVVAVLVLSLVAIVVARKDLGADGKEIVMDRKREAILSTVIGMAVGMYDGLIGPGAGTFLILGFTTFIGIGLVEASACAKVSNMASNLTSVLIFAFFCGILSKEYENCHRVVKCREHSFAHR